MNVKLFTPYKAQQDFIDKFVTTEDLFGVLVAPRGSGKTLAAINFAPDSTTKLKNLEFLDLRKNFLAALPVGLCHLQRLSRLYQKSC